MRRGQLWAGIRPRLVVLGAMALVLGGGWLVGGRSVHFGPPPPYNPPYVSGYDVVELYAGNADFTEVGGSIVSNAFQDCPNLVLIFNSARGYLPVGLVPAGGFVRFRGMARTWQGTPYRVDGLDRLSPRIYLACEPSTNAW